jgi:succinate dehydrogenase / fumarate reductase cytochrome b subunit
MSFMKSSVGKKILMAITGLMLLCFILIHLAGNSTIFMGLINAYGEHLHALPFLVWAFRLMMLTVFLIHIFFGIQLALENNTAKPQAYTVKKYLRASFSSRTMIWTGALIAGFLIYHILHFTLHVINPEIAAGVGSNMDKLGRPDMFKMIVLSFRQPPVATAYVVAMVVLAFHLAHGVQSFFQTLGLNNEKSLPFFEKAGMLVSIIISIGYISIPVAIVIGILNLKG